MTSSPTRYSGDDPEALEAKYAAEQARRMVRGRADIHDLAGDERFSRYRADPWTAFQDREPVTREVDVAIVGAGMGGLVVAARLREQGTPQIAMIDEAGGFGGTWYWNRYPGVMCDIESTIYLPMLEEMDYVPKHRYAFGEEIRTYFDSIAEKYDLRSGALFHTRVERTEWSEDDARWRLTTDRGDTIRARFVILAVGFLNRMKLPALPGMENFRGPSFHTARWDYEVTGGSPADSSHLERLEGKRVGIIGTGASAVQCVPPLARSCEELFVFQRTPSAIGVRDNRPTDAAIAQSRHPGWQAERMDNFASVMLARPTSEDVIDDGWTRNYAPLLTPRVDLSLPLEEIARQIDAVDHGVMDAHRTRVDEIVRDPAKAEILKPYYRYLCKRPLFHDEYLPAIDRPNVTLVDCPAGVERITQTGLVVDGETYDVDVLIYATGFEGESTPIDRKLGHPVVGRRDTELGEKWRDGVRSLHGVVSRGFPNLFLMPAPYQQAVVTVTHTHITVEGAAHIAETIGALDTRSIRAFEVSESAENAWVEQIVAAHVDGTPFLASCTPSRFNFEGDPAQSNPMNGSFGGSAGDLFGYRDLLADWREKGDFEGFELELG